MRFAIDELRKSVVKILKAFGENPQEAEWVADCLIKADMRGVSTHGIFLLRSIANRVRAGMLVLPTELEVIMNDGATALVDGKNGLGPVAGHKAMEICIEKAKQYGIGMVLIRNTNNIGSLAYYTQLAAEENMIALMSTNAAPSMAPWGGSDSFIGTNPIAISIPTLQNFSFTADMASSVVARGKIRKASRQNIEIPDNWAIDKNGIPTTDPNEALMGTLLPMGGPKGSAIALAVDMIAGIMAGSRYGPDLKSFHVLEGPTGVGASCIAIDINRFMEFDQFQNLLSDYINSAKRMNKANGFTEILMPGEIEYRNEQNSTEQGVYLDPQTVADFNELMNEIDKKIGNL